jgi:predicted O-methyltransferase YrrM
MIVEQIQATLKLLYNDSKLDKLKMLKCLPKNLCKEMQPTDFKEMYLSISKEQGDFLTQLIIDNKLKNMVEFGTSFGISTLFLAHGALETKGHIITTELIESKALKAIENFKKAGVSDLIEVRIGNALETLKNHNSPIDLLLLDGWKDLYLPLFRLLEPQFHANTFIYVDNANMAEVKDFLETISQNKKYQLQADFDNRTVLITIKK